MSPQLPSFPPSVPRLPLVPDPLRRVRVPKNLGGVTDVGEEDPRSGGITKAAAERIWRAATDLYRSGVHPALQLCLRRRGEVVLDRAVGHARGNGPGDPEDAGKGPVRTGTPFCVYSTSKAVSALVVHMLDERGALSISEPVAEYIPEFARHGKDGITIGHVLAHRAGIARLPEDALDLDNVERRDYLLELICDVKPSSAPGKLLAYHAVSGGFILGELVLRVTGKDIRQVLAETVLDPLGFRWMSYGVRPGDVEEVGLSYVTGPPVLPPVSTIVTRALGQPVDKVVEASNDPRFLTGIVPSANVVTSANELCRFFEI